MFFYSYVGQKTFSCHAKTITNKNFFAEAFAEHKHNLEKIGVTTIKWFNQSVTLDNKYDTTTEKRNKDEKHFASMADIAAKC